MAILDGGAPVQLVAIDKTGKLFATADRYGVVRVWDIKAIRAAVGTKPREVPGLSKPDPNSPSVSPLGPVFDVSLSDDGSKAAVALQDATVRLWNIQQNGDTSSFGDNDVIGDFRRPVRAVAFSPRGNFIAIAAGPEIYVWRPGPEKQKLLGIVGSHEGVVNSVAFNHSGDRLLSASEDGTAVVWSLPPLEAVFRRAASRVRNGDVANILEDMKLRDEDRHVIQHAGGSKRARIWRAVFSADGRLVVTAGSDGYARVWPINGPPVEWQNAAEVYTAAFSSRVGSRVATGGADSLVRVWDTEKKQYPEQEYSADTQVVRAIGFDASYLVVGTGPPNNSIKVWDTDSQELIQEFVGASADVSSLAINEARHLLLSGSFDVSVRVLRCDPCMSAGEQLSIVERRLARVKRVTVP